MQPLTPSQDVPVYLCQAWFDTALVILLPFV